MPCLRVDLEVEVVVAADDAGVADGDGAVQPVTAHVHTNVAEACA